MVRGRNRRSGGGGRERGIQLPLLMESDRCGGKVDRVPELTHYQDEGCRFWRACLSCPFPQCVFDLPGGPSRAMHAYRDGEIRRMYAAGTPALAIAEHFGMARRSVYRVLGGVRQRGGNGQLAMGNREHKPRGRAHARSRG